MLPLSKEAVKWLSNLKGTPELTEVSGGNCATGNAPLAFVCT